MIWNACSGVDQIKPIAGTLHRLVESQEQIATTGYVDTLEEQGVLEELLETSKPPYPDGTPSGLHYLLKTPFRYPPLLWGSRFGRVHEPSLFYGGASVDATLAESAYYRLVFLLSMEGEPPKQAINSEHTLFSIGYATERGIQLHQPPFDAHTDGLTHPANYGDCQAVGTAMRDAGVEGFEYPSARDPQKRVCVALFTPSPFTSHEPNGIEQWLCQTLPDGVTFKSVGRSRPIRIPSDLFLVGGNLPMPA
ncbi:MAG: RES family NAD+ phosphorylase [Motiliproteus sp.]